MQAFLINSVAVEWPCGGNICVLCVVPSYNGIRDASKSCRIVCGLKLKRAVAANLWHCYIHRMYCKLSRKLEIYCDAVISTRVIFIRIHFLH